MRAYSVGPPAPPGAVRLHLNEFRFPHPPGVVAAAEGLGLAAPLADYPAGPDPELVGALEAFVGAPPGGVAVAAGSDEALRAVVDASGGGAVLMGAPGYSHFAHFVRLRGRRLLGVPFGLGEPEAARSAALRYHAAELRAGALVYLCSPNNPTGDLWGAEVGRLAADFPASLFLVDEAYVEFAGAAAGGEATDAAAALALGSASLAPLALAADNVLVSRTFSKAFGLAALRVGYLVGRPGPGGALALARAALSPKAVGAGACRVALAALRAPLHYLLAAAEARGAAAAAAAVLRAAGWWVLETPANFFLVYAGAGDAAASLAASGVLVRDRGDQPGLAGFLRVSAGSAADMAALVTAFGRLAPPPRGPPQALSTPKGRIAAIKGLVRAAAGVLGAAGVPFWAQAGTLLGVVRHGGIVPSDDDADLGYPRGADGADPVAGLGGAFAGAGLRLRRNRTDAYWQVDAGAGDGPLEPAHLDLFSFSRAPPAAGAPGGDPEAGAAFVVDDPRFRDPAPASPEGHCNFGFLAGELFPLRAGRFYDLDLPIPAAAEAVLARALGGDFMTRARARGPDGRVALEFELTDPTPA